MADPTFLGIGKQTWDLYNGFANWFAALGSFAAAAAALYIASKSWRPRADVHVGLRVIVTPGTPEPWPEYVQFKIVNTGDRPIRVVQIGWRTGVRKRRYAIQMFEQTLSSELPIELTHGQEATWMVPTALRDEPWATYFSRDFLEHWLAIVTLRAQFHTSLGVVFSAKPEPNLLVQLTRARAAINSPADRGASSAPR